MVLFFFSRSSGDVQSGSEDGKVVESAVPTFELDLDDSIVVEDDVPHEKEAKVEPEEAKGRRKKNGTLVDIFH